MKNLIPIIFLFITISSQSQDKTKPDSTYKVYNPNGSYALVEKRGNKENSTTKFSVVNSGKTSVITNPDGSKSTVVNDVATGSIYATDGSLSTNVRVVTPEEAKAIEASKPKGFYITNADGTTSIGMNIYNGKSEGTYSTSSTTTTGPIEMTLAEKAMANYLPRPAVEHAVIANKSVSNLGRFEMDLYSGNKDVRKAPNNVWLSIGTDSINELVGGVYDYGDKSATDRGAFKFYGSVKTGTAFVDITGGSVTVKVDKSVLNVEYNLNLKNGQRVSGRYSGKYKAEDWRHL
jgi:hypothetical protein